MEQNVTHVVSMPPSCYYGVRALLHRSCSSLSFHFCATMAAPTERSMPKSGARSPLNTPSFNLVKPFEHELGARLGCFSFPGRQPIETPHYIAISSRGAVPHLSQDTMKESTSIQGLYAGLEDCKLGIETPFQSGIHFTDTVASRS